MAGRYVLTPARRAALKKAQAKSAAKRRGRGQYRAANRVARKNVNQKFRKGGYHKKGLKGLGDAAVGAPRRRAQLDYDRAKNSNAVKYKGKKKLTDKQLKNRRRAKTAATLVASIAVNQALRQAGKSEYTKVAEKNRKANKKRYNQDKKQSLKARKRNFKAAGLNKNGTTKRSRKPVKVTSQRLPGQAMLGSGPVRRTAKKGPRGGRR